MNLGDQHKFLELNIAGYRFLFSKNSKTQKNSRLYLFAIYHSIDEAILSYFLYLIEAR